MHCRAQEGQAGIEPPVNPEKHPLGPQWLSWPRLPGPDWTLQSVRAISECPNSRTFALSHGPCGEIVDLSPGVQSVGRNRTAG